MLVVVVSMAIVGETIYGFSLISKLKSTPRAPMTIGQDVDKALKQPGRISALVDGVLNTPIEAPTPADRLPPPLPPSPKSAIKPATTVVPPAPKPEPSASPTPALVPPSVKVTETKPGQPVLETLPQEVKTPSPAKPAVALPKTATIPPPAPRPENQPEPPKVAMVIPKRDVPALPPLVRTFHKKKPVFRT
jgi:hypothetical protein